MDIEDTVNPHRVTVFSLRGGVVCRWAGSCGRVEGELAQDLAGGSVDDADVQVLDQEQDVGSGVGAAGADVEEPAGVAEGDDAVGVDPVGADAVVGVAGAAAGGALGRAA